MATSFYMILHNGKYEYIMTQQTKTGIRTSDGYAVDCWDLFDLLRSQVEVLGSV